MMVLNSMGDLKSPLFATKKLSLVPIFRLKAEKTLDGSFSTYSLALSPIRIRSFLNATTLGKVTFIPEGFLKRVTLPLLAFPINEFVVPRSIAKLIVPDIDYNYLFLTTTTPFCNRDRVPATLV